MFIKRDDWPAWSAEMAAWLDQRFNGRVLAQFNLYVDGDRLTWLDEQQALVDGCYQDSAELFEHLLSERYSGIQIFHATRLVDLDAVRQQGVRAWSKSDLINFAYKRFEGIVEAENLKRVIESCNPKHRGGRVYSFASLHHVLGIYDESELGRLPSFCVSGGEFIAAVGKCAGVHEEVAKRPDRGYILACNLPWSRLSPDDLRWIARDVLLTVIVDRFFGPTGYNMFGSSECVSTNYDILPEYIECVADVENLIGRSDLTVRDIAWSPFH